MSEVKDNPSASGVLSDPATICEGGKQIRTLITRYWAEAAVFAIVFVLWMPRLSGPIDLRWDAGVYYLLGTSLATGQGYRILSEPGAPEAVQYPPLLPAVVALYERALGSTDPAVVAPWLRKTYFAIFIAYALAVIALAKRYLRPWLALVAATLCLLQIMTIFLSDLLFAELPFALISVLFALVTIGRRLSPFPLLRETVLFVLAAAGFLLRTAGIVLFAAWVIEAVVQRRWQLALVRLLLAVVPILAWQANVVRVHKSQEYTHPPYAYQRAAYQNYNVTYSENISLVDPFRPERGLADRGALTKRLLANFANVPAELGGAVSTVNGYWRMFLRDLGYYLRGIMVVPRSVTWAPIFGIAALVSGGFIIFLVHRDWIMVIIPLLSIALVCLTPWPEEFRRYLMPMVPFLAIAAILAARWLDLVCSTWGSRWPSLFERLILISLLLLTFSVQVYAARSAFQVRGAAFTPGRDDKESFRFFYHDNSWRAWEEAAFWIGAHASPGEIVATIAPHQLYLQTGLHAVYPPMEIDPQVARRQLEAVPVSYVIVDDFRYRDFSRRYARPAVESDPAHWSLVYSINGTRVYQRVNRAE
jgi:hypothetical protein